jgi:hypothetical protein
MKRIFAFVFTLGLFAVASTLPAQTNPQIGIWTLNVAKSKYVNLAPPKSETRTIVAQGDGAKVSIDGVAADGSRIADSYTTNYDGKDSPLIGAGRPNGEEVAAIMRVDANTLVSTSKKGDKVVLTTRFVVSKDGKTMTITSKGTNEKGQPTSSTSIWEKQ